MMNRVTVNNIKSIDDFNNLTDADLRDMFDDIEFNLDGERKIPDQEKKDVCPKCLTADNVVADTIYSILVCTNCGQVINNLVDQNPEWRHFEDDAKNESRCSMPVNKLLPQSSLGTSIAGNFKSRLKTLHTWSQMPYKERSLNTVFKIIQSKCHKGNILKCIEDDAKIMYKSISECKHVRGKNAGKFIIIRGKNRQSLIASCVFFACRRNSRTRSPREIADLFELKYTEITKGCKNFIKLMKIRKLGINMGTSQPDHFITRFCNDLKIKKQYVEQAICISRNIRKLDIASVHNPYSTATSSILLMAELNDLQAISKKKLSSKFNVSEVTITKTYKKIEQFKKILVDDTRTDQLVNLIRENRKRDKIPDVIMERIKRFQVVPLTRESWEPKLVTPAGPGAGPGAGPALGPTPELTYDIDDLNINDIDLDLSDLPHEGLDDEDLNTDDLDADDDDDHDDDLDADADADDADADDDADTTPHAPYLDQRGPAIEDNLEEYIDNVNLDLYEKMAHTERKYHLLGGLDSPGRRSPHA